MSLACRADDVGSHRGPTVLFPDKKPLWSLLSLLSRCCSPAGIGHAVRRRGGECFGHLFRPIRLASSPVRERQKRPNHHALPPTSRSRRDCQEVPAGEHNACATGHQHTHRCVARFSHLRCKRVHVVWLGHSRRAAPLLPSGYCLTTHPGGMAARARGHGAPLPPPPWDCGTRPAQTWRRSDDVCTNASGDAAFDCRRRTLQRYGCPL
jgi:hypothetical protein